METTTQSPHSNNPSATVGRMFTDQGPKPLAPDLDAVLARLKKTIEEAPVVPATIAAKAPRPSQLAKPSSPSVTPPSKPLALRDDPEGQNQLTRLLSQTYAMMKKYGERASETEMRDAGFQQVFANYPIQRIEAAFLEYLKIGREIPTPADIFAIMDPTTQPLSEAVYIRISRKNPFDRDSSELAYMRAFEEREMRKLA